MLDTLFTASNNARLAVLHKSVRIRFNILVFIINTSFLFLSSKIKLDRLQFILYGFGISVLKLTIIIDIPAANSPKKYKLIYSLHGILTAQITKAIT